jgi:protein TonB
VIVDIYIDENGIFRNVVVLKDPGYGFAEAAVNGIKEALKDEKCIPAMDENSKPINVKYRIPIPFRLKK